MTLRKREEAGIWNRKLWIAHSGEMALAEVMDLSQGILGNELMGDLGECQYRQG